MHPLPSDPLKGFSGLPCGPKGLGEALPEPSCLLHHGTTGTSASSVSCVSLGTALGTRLGWTQTNKAHPDPLLCEGPPHSPSFRVQISPCRAQLQGKRAEKIPPGAFHFCEILQRVPW